MKKSILFVTILAFYMASCTVFTQPSKQAEIQIRNLATTYIDPTANMEFVLVKGGCFDMGDILGDGETDEKPVHQVCIKDYYIGKYLVTQEQWKTAMGNNPSNFTSCGGNCPVDKISWFSARQFMQILNQRSGKNYRLPTEAEWEFAARSGGKKEKWAGTNSEAELDDYAWYASNSKKQTHAVGQKKPNGLGLYDMTGNVWEWVEDWYGAGYYSNSPKENPQGPGSGFMGHRGLRGGSWDSASSDARVFRRYNHGSDREDSNMGLRLVMTP